MTAANVIVEVTHFVECPHCQQSKSRIDHLFSEGSINFGTWYCDECGKSYTGKVVGREVFVEKAKGRKDKSLVFLKKDNLLIVVEGMYFDGELDIEQSRYFYEQHTCPENYFRDTVMVINSDNGDKDPHGIFKFVGVIPYHDLEDIEEIQKLIPLKV